MIPALVSRWLDEGAVLSPGLEGDIQNGRAKSHLGAPWSTTENDSMIDTTIYPGAPSGGNPLNDPRAAAWLRLWHPGAWPWLLADPEEGRGLRACAGVRRDWLVWWSERWAVLPEALRADWLTAAVEGGDRGV